MVISRKGLWGFDDDSPVEIDSPFSEFEHDEKGEVIVPVTSSSDVAEMISPAIPKKKLKKRKPTASADTVAEHIDFEDLDILASPFVEEFKEKFGGYPILVIGKYCKLPVRYMVDSTTKKFRMVGMEAGQELVVSGMEAGKKVPWNILCPFRGDEAVLEPSMVTKFCKIVNPSHSSFKKTRVPEKKPATDYGKYTSKTTGASSPAPSEPKVKPKVPLSKELKGLIEKRKKEAVFSL
ncbi:MAG: hypothetical protein JEZ11_17915 [Desulfobacterales bacterium]|nr:hypothetical protein [Desulfobacterales bacterium]